MYVLEMVRKFSEVTDMSKNLKPNQVDIEELIETIESELSHGGCGGYITKEGIHIATDAGYVYDWFEEYKEILRMRYKRYNSRK